MLTKNNMVGDPGHYAGANIEPSCKSYSEGTNMLLLGKELNKRYKLPLTRYNGNDVSFGERAKRAKVTGRKYCVSLHTNYPERGVVVFISVNRPQDRKEAERLGRAVSKKLGIAFKGVRTRLYPGTSSTDYYAMIRLPLRQGLIPFIIEHGAHAEHCSNTAHKRDLICDAYGEIFGEIIVSSDRGYMQNGDIGEDVKELQQDLLELGYKFKYNGKTYGADGSYGKATENAVKELQRKNNLDPDGVAGKNTLAKIKALLKKKAEELYSNDIIDLPKEGYFQEGDKDREISFLQEELNIIGFLLEIDGSYGPATTKAVKEFQKMKKLKVDGVVGKDTVKAIGEETERLEKNGIIDLPGVGYYQQGDNNEEIKLIQEVLIKLNLADLEGSGNYGAKTEEGVRKLQKKYNLKEDGVAGKDTVRAMNSLIREGIATIRRVYIDGKKIGAYREKENILAQIEKNINKSEKIEIVKKK